MQQDILINWSPQETRVAVIEHGALQELQVERSLERGLVGNVYLGKVARVLPGMQSAFVDIGLEKAAFLHVADLMSSINSRHADDVPAAPPQPIEKQLFEGQAVMVQVLKDPIGTKGARLTAQIPSTPRTVQGRGSNFFPPRCPAADLPPSTTAASSKTAGDNPRARPAPPDRRSTSP